MKTTIPRFLSMAVRMTTRSGAHKFPHILLFLFLAVYPTVARAACGDSGDIPFTVTLLNPLPSNSNASLSFAGPFYRSASLVLRDLTVGEPCTFYAAKDTVQSPFGGWLVATRSGNALRFWGFELDRTESGVNRVDITVDPLEDNRFVVHIYTGGKRTAEALEETAGQLEAPAGPSAAKEVSVKAWLGDSTGNSEGILETDGFFFFGTAGDTVTIRLEADTQGGNNGGNVALALQGPTGRLVHGTLPKTITAELPSTARYAILVKQPLGVGGKDYVGGYILRVKSAQGKISSLIPARSVEK